MVIRFLLLIVTSVFTNAQTDSFTIKGLVNDEYKNPISDAIINIQDNYYEYSANTDEKGNFSKKLYSAGEKIKISISKKGYDSLYTEVTPNR